MTLRSTPAATEGAIPKVRPPFSGRSAKLPGAAGVTPPRVTAMERRLVEVRIRPDTEPGYLPTHPYVRRFWIAALGPGAVADLLRLTAAAHRGRPLKAPLNLPTLISEGLAAHAPDGAIEVGTTVPGLSDAHVARLRPALRREHQRTRPPARSPA